nr:MULTISPECIES: 50S ribosomal protein L11 methyltransferase [unclassified Prochlorococcus]
MNLGGIYKDLGNLDQTLASTLKSLELKPDNHTALMNLGGIYIDLGQLDQALIAAKKSMELDALNPNCYVLLSSVYQKANNPTQAKEVCEQGLRISSKNIRLQNNLSEALSQITPLWHIAMMNDADRNRCYAEAINKAVKPNDLVLDIGAGAGLLSMMAAEAGASEVIACEMVIPIANKAQAIVRKNGFEDKIRLFGMKSTNVKIGKEMPQKADVIISEVFSSGMVGEGILPTLQDSRERLLKEGGLMIPEQAEIKFALIGASPEVSRLTNPGADSCYCLEDFSEICPRKIPAKLTERPNLLSEAEAAFHFDFRKPFAFKSEKRINVTVAKGGQCIGIIQWLKTILFGDIVYENIPGEISSHWSSNIYLFQNPISVKQGQSIKINALVEKDMLWFQHCGLDS